jgi:hypothetical protein
MRRPAALWILAGVGFALVAVIAVELAFPADADEPPDRAIAARASEAGEPSALEADRSAQAPTLENQILARPLFAADRRPPNVPSSGGGEAVQTPNDLPRLAGIATGVDLSIAIFQPRDAGKPIAVAEGGEIAGRKVQTIDPLEVVVLGPEGEEHLHVVPDPALAHEGGAADQSVDEAPQPRRQPIRPVAHARPPGFTPPERNLPGRPGRPIRAMRGPRTVIQPPPNAPNPRPPG